MGRSLDIAVICHARHPISPPFKGGMEAHSYHLINGLAARGHRVTAFAAGDSQLSVPLVPLFEHHYDGILPPGCNEEPPELARQLDAAYTSAAEMVASGGFDIVHNNSLHSVPIEAARKSGIALVSSLHVPPFEALSDAVMRCTVPNCRFMVTSRKQLHSWWGDTPSPQAAVVHNGIDLALWRNRMLPHTRNGRAVWTGRISFNKGTHLALQAAHLAGMGLDLFGPIEDMQYFETQCRPLLDEHRLYRGHRSAGELAEEYAKASVFAFTPLWDEPFGLVAIEAMASGVPVAGTDMGAVREVVGDCGKLAAANTAPAIAEAMLKARDIPSDRCVERVREFFTLDRMLDGYERQYALAMGDDILAAHSANAA
jgi:glycosyltransferase involved in cell wall biosynthesis